MQIIDDDNGNINDNDCFFFCFVFFKPLIIDTSGQPW